MAAPDVPSAVPQLRDAPLLYIVMVVDIAPIFNVSEYVPKLQDAMRRSGYPLSGLTHLNQLVFNSEGVTSTAIPQWNFMAASRTASVLLSETRIGFETTRYQGFEAFCQDVTAMLEVVLSQLGGVVITQRLGLRYINALQPQPGEEFGSIFKEQLVGFGDDFAGVQNSNVQLFFQGNTDEGMLTVRVIQPPVGLGQGAPLPVLPFDLSTQLTVSSTVDVQRKFRFLDLDHSAAVEQELTAVTLLPILARLHDKIEEAFLSSVNQAAYDRWASQG